MIETMTIEEMMNYTGRQDPPIDMDKFWQNEKNKVSTLANYHLEKKAFNLDFVDCYELTFTGTNDSQIYSKCLFPKAVDKVPTLFYFHGYQGQSPDWTENLKYVCAGYGVVCMDVRGQAGRSQDLGLFDGMTVKGQVIRGAIQGKETLFYKDVYLDIYQLVEIVASLDFVDETNLMSCGGSQGGALALICAALNEKIKKTVAIYPFLSDFKRVLELGNHSEPYDELFRYFKFSDPFHNTEEFFLSNLSYIDVKNFASKIKCPVLMITGLEDDVCPPSTQFAIYNRIQTEKEIKILPEYGHEAMNVKVNDLIYDYLIGSTIIDVFE
ncbi:acetylxylan esterase [Enterococcus dongliensis]|uniref:acetylxylan esterase n=1 Tax=Enterococcus dongliensis TaxID=2559925 RepID=UPI0028927847|nr:acetylxylan esterase [Enterococcus dongliensis]MDT2613491.1 acetylxylan esterase [Enterococcus dongliensis]